MLKKLLILSCLLAGLSHAQQIRQCQRRFDQYLNFRGSLARSLTFQQDVIFLNSGGKKVLAIYEDEIPALAAFMSHSTFAQQEKLLRDKGLRHFGKRQLDSLGRGTAAFPAYDVKQQLPLQGFKIALDPGHFGTNMTDAKVEQKYLYFARTAGGGDSVKLFESALTFNTASLLKGMLEEKGATVMLTRDQANHTSFNCTYGRIFEKRKQLLDSLSAIGQMSPARYSTLLKASSYNFFWDFFRDFDLVNRAAKINEFAPHVTLIIHYNVDEKNVPWTRHSNKNFTMAFIGGAFTADNLEKTEGRVNFVRLLITDQLDRSNTLAKETVSRFKQNLDIEIAKAGDADYLKNNCLSTASPGVFCRNLALCRRINSPLVYGESLYQDNVDESARLMKNDLDLYGIKTNQRLQQVAKAYLEGLLAFLVSQR